jgi:mannobiose 2-epimerase
MSTTISQPAAPPITTLLASYAQEMSAELTRITDFWLAHTLDERRGGFIGQMDSAGQIDAQADKGSILNARILWTFSCL